MNCVDEQVLGAFVEGKLDPRRRREVMEHLETCDVCTSAAGLAAESLREESRVVRMPVRTGWWLAAAAMLVTGLLAIAVVRDRWPGRSPIRTLVAAVPSDRRPVEPRLTGGFAWAEYRGPVRDADAGRSDPQRLRLQGAAGDVLDRASKDASPETAHAAAIALLLIDDPAQAIEKLRPLAADDAAAWSDLAAAYYASGRPSLLPQALAAADRALEIDPKLPEARFNRALVLERMGLLAEARKAWERYVEADPSSAWATEARAHLARLANRRSSFQHDLQHLSPADLAAKHPQRAREWGEGPFLAEWAEGGGKLDEARAIGAALAKQSGETLLRDAVAAIDRAADPGPLIEGHLLYREGRIAYSRRELAKAQDALERAAEALARGGSPMALAARYFAANVVYDLNRPREAFDRLTALLGTVPPSYRALRAQILWQRALCSSTMVHWSEAVADAEESRAIFDALGEESNRASVDVIAADLLESGEELDQAWERRIAAFEVFSREEKETRLIAALGSAMRGEVRRGNGAQARSLSAIEIEAARAGTNHGLLAVALFHRALLLHRSGGGDPMPDLAEARAIAPRTGDAQRVLAEIDYAEGVIARGKDPRRAVELLSRSSEFFRASFPFYLPAALLERGRALRDQGRHDEARADFLAGIEAIEARRDPRPAAELEAAALFDDEQSLFGELVRIALARQETREALAYADRALQHALRSRYPAAAVSRAPVEENGEARLRIYAAGDDVVVFAASGSRVDAVRAGGAEPVRAAARALVDALASRKPEEELRVPAASLYATLVAPVRQSLSGVGTIVVVADPRLGFIPFPALFDAERGKYLVEDFEIVVRPAAALPVREPAALSAAAAALVVADPEAEGVPLPGAEREAREVAASYRAARVLAGRQATPDAFVRGLAAHRVIHYAGHAAAPARSAGALLLAGGRLYATEISRLDLRGVDLVVLAACRSSRAAHAAVPRDLATAFVVAGARNVVGTGWELDDATSASTFADLHRAVAAGVRVAAAVRDAQLSAIRAKRHPSSWAALTLLSMERS